MNGGRRRMVFLAVLGAGGSGVVYAVMRFLLTPSDPWSVVNHPWEPAVQHLHVLTAPLLVFAVGLIWERHVAGHWRSGNGCRRLSGSVLAALFVFMAASGYVLQVSVDEAWRRLWSALHVGSSALWLGVFVGHAMGARLARARGGEEVRGGGPAGDPVRD